LPGKTGKAAKKTRLSNWRTKNLSKDQITYAGLDAIVHLQCYMELKKLQQSEHASKPQCGDTCNLVSYGTAPTVASGIINAVKEGWATVNVSTQDIQNEMALLPLRPGDTARVSFKALAKGKPDNIFFKIEWCMDALHVTKLTCMSRKEMEQTMARQAQEANVNAMLSKLSRDELKNFQANLAQASELGPELEGAFKDLADGVAQTDLGKTLAAMSPEFKKFTEDSAKGRVTSAEFQDRLKKIAPNLEKFRDDMGGAGSSALMGQAGFGELLSSGTRKTSVSKFQCAPEWCEVRRRVLYNICKKCISRARAPRGRDAWDALIDIKSDSTI
jgi:hypothetical protein